MSACINTSKIRNSNYKKSCSMNSFERHLATYWRNQRMIYPNRIMWSLINIKNVQPLSNQESHVNKYIKYRNENLLWPLTPSTKYLVRVISKSAITCTCNQPTNELHTIKSLPLKPWWSHKSFLNSRQNTTNSNINTRFLYMRLCVWWTTWRQSKENSKILPDFWGHPLPAKWTNQQP